MDGITERKVSVDLRLEIARYMSNAAKVVSANKAMQGSLSGVSDESGHVDSSMEDLAKNTDKARVSTDKMRASTEKNRRSFHGLNDDINRTKMRINELAAQYDRVGNIRIGKSDLFRQMRDERTHLSEIQRIRKELDGVEKKTKQIVDLGRQRDRRGGLLGMLGDLAGKSAFGVPAPLLAAGGAGIALAAPSAILAGAGLLGLGAGIALQMRSTEVKSAYTDLGHHIMTSLHTATFPFRQELVDSAKLFDEAWRRAEPGLATTFKKLAGDVVPFTKGLIGFGEGLLPGLERAASGPFMKSFSAELPRIGQSLGDFFDSIERGGPGAINFFHSLSDAAQVMVRSTGTSLEVLSKGWAGANKFGGMTGSLEFLGRAANDAGPLFAQTAVMIHRTSEELMFLRGAIPGTAAEFAALSDRMSDTFSNTLRLATANADFKKGYLDLKESIEANGRTLDENTRKGQANADTLRSQIGVAKSIFDAEIAAAGGSVIKTAAADAQLRQHLDTIRAWALKLGLPRAQVEAILSAYYALLRAPNINKEVTVTGKALGGSRHAFAEGGTPPIGRPYWVGERGRELRFDTRPGYVMPHDASERFASLAQMNAAGGSPASGGGRGGGGAGGGSAAVTMTVTGSSGSGLDAMFRSWFMEQVRVGGIVIRQQNVRA